VGVGVFERSSTAHRYVPSGRSRLLSVLLQGQPHIRPLCPRWHLFPPESLTFPQKYPHSSLETALILDTSRAQIAADHARTMNRASVLLSLEIALSVRKAYLEDFEQVSQESVSVSGVSFFQW
jgi:hypothetical protein